MPVTVEIDGIGEVELDDSFRQKTAAEQEAIISEIVSQVRGSRGGERQRSAPEATPTKDARLVIGELFPDARITDWKRDPNSDLGRANPDSWHTRSGAAVDMAPIPGMTYEEAVKRFEDAGYVLLEDIDEVKNPSGHATGPHWHFVIGVPPGGLKPREEDGSEQGQPSGTSQDLPEPTPAAPAPESPEVAEGSSFFGIPDKDQLLKGLEYGTGAVVEGLGDAVGVFTNPFATSLGRALGYDNYTADLGGDLRDSLGLDRPPESDTGNRIAGDIVSGAAGGIGFSGGARLAGKAAQSALARAALAELGATPVRDAVAGGASALASDAAEAAGAGAAGQTAAALIGGAAGYGGASLAKAVTPEAKATRFAAAQAKKNPAAAFDAEIVADLAAARKTLDRSKTDPKARAPLDVKVINDVQDSYTDQTIELIKQLQLPKMEELRFRNALSRKHSLPQDEIDALRGSVAGDAVADAIVKTQRIKRLTPEIAHDKSLLTKTGDVVSTGLDLIPGIPGITGRAVRWATRAAAGDAEAARVHAAQRLLAKQRGYEKLGQIVGPSGQRQSRQALWDEASQAVSAREAAGAEPNLEKIARSKDKAWNAVRKMEGNTPPSPSKRRMDEDRAWAARNRDATISEAEKQRQMDKAWAETEPAKVPSSQLKSEVSHWEAILKTAEQRRKAKAAAIKATTPKLSFDTPSASKAKAPSVRDQLIEKAVTGGMKGSSRTRDVFKERLGGLDDDQLDQVLNTMGDEFPDAKPELDRIRMNHPTKDRRFGSAADPHLRSAMEKLGIAPKATPKTAPVDEAAQQRLETFDTSKPAPKPTKTEADLLKELDEVDPVVMQLADGAGVRASEADYSLSDTERARSAAIQEELRQLRRIDRPVQWEQGKNRYVAQANGAIEQFQADKSINPLSKSVIGSAPVQIRDNFKTTSEALEFIEKRVLPDLEAEGVSSDEIARVKTYLSDVAHAKPYYDPDSYAQGTKANPRGRPPKTQ